MEYTEDDYLMISGIQHFKFCRRQWALIHVESAVGRKCSYSCWKTDAPEGT